MNKNHNNNKTKQAIKAIKHKSKARDMPLTISRMFNLNVISIDIELTQSVYLRTGQTISSFSSGSQVYSLNLSTLIVNSNNYQKYLTSGIPNFEFIKVSGFALTWYPSNVVSTQGTFEPAAFDLRYFSCYSIDSVLPSGYQANYNESHYNVLLQQSAKPFTKIFPLKELPTYIVDENNRQCLGQMINAYNFTTYASSHGGLLSIIQTTPSVNSVSAYNPKLGFIELKFHIELFNSII
jgi:hypothetical protein